MSTTETTAVERAAGAGVIWDEHGDLVPLNNAPCAGHMADVAVIIVNRNRPDLTGSLVEQLRAMGRNLEVDTYVVEMGSDTHKLSRHCSIHYEDEQFRGKCYGHNVGLRLARARGNYRYFWALMNDLVFEPGVDAIEDLVSVADANPQIAVLSPTELHSAYQGCRPRRGCDFHLVSTCDYLALLVRAEAVDQVGFLNPAFRYCWGAIHEFAYKLYDRGWHVAYCDRVTMRHLGGTTYGMAKDTISRDEYRKRAMEFAARYFVEHYGKSWDSDFAQVLPPEIECNTFPLHRDFWEAVLDPQERDMYQSSPNSQIMPGGLLKERQRGPQGSSTDGAAAAATRADRDTQLLLGERSEELNPWYYEVDVGGIRVTPGVGSRQSAADLKARVGYRTKLLVDDVAGRYDFTGKRLLDLAANCGYWSARYAELGATSLLAVEGRAQYVEQGRLYWEHNRFMTPGSFSFLHGNVLGGDTWRMIRQHAPFDFTLCCGILYHIPEYERVIHNAASVTTEAMLIDTRVSDNEERICEPGGWCFDAIVETRDKKMPRLDRINAILQELGFRSECLTVDMPTPQALKGADDYAEGRRVALLAVRPEGVCEKEAGMNRAAIVRERLLADNGGPPPQLCVEQGCRADVTPASSPVSSRCHTGRTGAGL